MSVKLSKEQINEHLSAEGRGIELIGEYLGAQKKSLFRCSYGHEWEAKPALVKWGKGCLSCANEKKTWSNESMLSWLSTDNRGITMASDYVGHHKKSLFRCNFGHEWSATPCNIKSGRGCPTCHPGGFNPQKPACIYILSFGSFIKFGITNSLKRRLSEHRSRNGDFLLVYSKHYDNGHLALSWENSIKLSYGGNFVTPIDCPDGHTETLSISLLDKLINTTDIT